MHIKQIHSFILKILAAPFVVLLTLVVAVLGFMHSLASWLFGMLSLLCAVCGIFEWFVRRDASTGIYALIVAFVFSPFGLPAVAEWLIDRLDGLNYSLKCFITD